MACLDYWTLEEDLQLLSLLATLGTKWKSITQMHFSHRTVASVRNRWFRIRDGARKDQLHWHCNVVGKQMMHHCTHSMQASLQEEEDALDALGFAALGRGSLHVDAPHETAMVITKEHVQKTCGGNVPSV